MNTENINEATLDAASPGEPVGEGTPIVTEPTPANSDEADVREVQEAHDWAQTDAIAAEHGEGSPDPHFIEEDVLDDMRYRIANNMGVADELNVLKAAVRLDPAYAWSWHCNLAMSFFDEGGDKPAANRGAARFMQLLFGVDTSKHEHFAATQPPPRPEGMETEGWRKIGENSYLISNSIECNEAAQHYHDLQVKAGKAMLPLMVPMLFPANFNHQDLIVTYFLDPVGDEFQVKASFTPLSHLRGKTF